MNKISKKSKIQIIIVFVVICIIIILGTFYRKEIYTIDNFILNFIRQFANNNLTEIMKVISNMCSATILCIISLFILVFLKKKSIGLIISLNLGLVASLNYILKIIFTRQRPINLMLVKEAGYSFPSGHAMTSIAFYGLLIYFSNKYMKNKYIKNIIKFVLTLLIILIGFSRLYLGVHYPSDVIAGFILGYIYLKLFILSMKKYFN
ncbi:MAG: phosphatase PAP2 family protein [Clostridia bacterium]